MTTFIIGLIGTISCIVGLSANDNLLIVTGSGLVVGHLIMAKVDKLNEN